MKQLLFLFLLTYSISPSFAQCVTVYPYTESFETGTNLWTTGGVNNDWAWGTPNKAFITTAGAGTKCWVTGSLTGNFYAFGERSYVQSPCFDFTNLQYPYISFKIYWESENIYDGTVFQSSIDNGVTWQNVGGFGDPIDCLNDNWFNQSNINNLTTLATPKNGWAGSQTPTTGSCQGGNGSNGWVTAKHCMSNLAGQSNVLFRFAFGAGTNCNAYDGVAFDDIFIGEAPTNNASFTYNCTGNHLEYQFNNTSTMCPTLHLWNFGDPASGLNASSFVNPTHIFSAPGTYTVTLTTSGPCNAPSTSTQTIITIQPNVSNSQPCFGVNNGSINVSATGGNGGYVFNANPPNSSNTSGIFSNLAAGLYTITTSDAGGCVVANNTILTQLSQIVLNTTVTNPLCSNNAQGNFTVTASGGAGTPYTYYTTPINQTNNTGIFNNLNVGIYTVAATDANGCSTATTININAPNAITWNPLNKVNTSCFGTSDGSINLSANGGTGTKTYTLQPNSQSNTSGSFTNLASGNYTITVSDANGCSNSSIVNIAQPNAIIINNISTLDPTCINPQGGSFTINTAGGTPPYNFSNGGAFQLSSTFNALSANTYTVIIKDANGCLASSVAILNPIFVPSISNIVANDLTCFNDNSGSIQITGSSNTTISNYTLDPGNISNGNGQFSNLGANTYSILITDANGCKTNTVVIIQNAVEIKYATANAYKVTCTNTSNGKIFVHAFGGTNSFIYTLLPNNSSNNNGTFNDLTIGTYTVTATDTKGCQGTSILKVEFANCCEDIIVPNAFSPNNDLRNDEYRINTISDIALNSLQIYNRWGNEVFKTNNITIGWNGKYKDEDADIGTYYYLLRYTCIPTGKEIIKKGDITLVR